MLTELPGKEGTSSTWYVYSIKTLKTIVFRTSKALLLMISETKYTHTHIQNVRSSKCENTARLRRIGKCYIFLAD
jgi:hypothetical protein